MRIKILSLTVLLAAVQSFAVNLNPPGTVSGWGNGSYQSVLVVFPAGVTPADISAYEYMGGLAVGNDGGLYDWFGVRGSPLPTVFPPPVTSVTAASRRESHTLAITNAGLYAWGGNDKGQLGDGTNINHYSPAPVVFPATVTTVFAVAAGYNHSLAITDDGLYAWGDNFNGEVGDGTRLNRSLPVKVIFPPTVTRVLQIAAGRATSYALTDDGLFAWGNDFSGQLGNGSFGILPNGDSDVGQTLPVRVLFNSRITWVSKVAAGEYYALAITNDGLYAWGMNLSGCLGAVAGTTALPAKVKFPKAVHVVTTVAASTNHTFAITDDGLYAWGNNSYGQLGIKSGSDQLTPVRVPGEANAIDIATSEYASIALH